MASILRTTLLTLVLGALATVFTCSTARAENVTNSQDVAFSIVSPKDGSLWVATCSRGLLRLGQTGRLFYYSKDTGCFPCDSIVALAFDSDGALWMKDTRGGVYSYSSLSGFVPRNDVPNGLFEPDADDTDDIPSCDAPAPVSSPSRRFPLILVLFALLTAALLYFLLNRGKPRSEVVIEPISKARAVPHGMPFKPGEIKAPANAPAGSFQAAVEEIIEMRFRNPEFSVETLAEEFGITRVHLSRKLKGEGSPSPSDLIRQRRMAAAVELIHSGVRNVSDVASRCGFSSAAYFSSAFKDYFGTSPKSYAENV